MSKQTGITAAKFFRATGSPATRYEWPRASSRSRWRGVIVAGKQKLQGNPAIWSSSRGVKYLHSASWLDIVVYTSTFTVFEASPHRLSRHHEALHSPTGQQDRPTPCFVAVVTVAFQHFKRLCMRRNTSRRLGMRRPWPEVVQIDELRNRQWCSLRTDSKTRKEEITEFPIV